MVNYRTPLGASSLHDWCLLRRSGNPLKDVLAYVKSRGGSALFCAKVCVPDDAELALPPIDALFELEARRIPGDRNSIAFSWEHREGFPLPSIHGTATARRFGPFVSMSLSGQYTKTADAAGELFDQALGRSLAQKTLTEALGSIRYILRQLPAKAANTVEN